MQPGKRKKFSDLKFKTSDDPRMSSGGSQSSRNSKPTIAACPVPSSSTVPGSKSPLMSHAERRKLIETPFMSRRIPPKSWGGVNVGNAGSVPETGHRTWQLSASDESYLRYGRSDDDTQGD